MFGSFKLGQTETNSRGWPICQSMEFNSWFHTPFPQAEFVAHLNSEKKTQKPSDSPRTTPRRACRRHPDLRVVPGAAIPNPSEGSPPPQPREGGPQLHRHRLNRRERPPPRCPNIVRRSATTTVGGALRDHDHVVPLSSTPCVSFPYPTVSSLPPPPPNPWRPSLR
jgi:hypothetical protein